MEAEPTAVAPPRSQTPPPQAPSRAVLGSDVAAVKDGSSNGNEDDRHVNSDDGEEEEQEHHAANGGVAAGATVSRRFPFSFGGSRRRDYGKKSSWRKWNALILFCAFALLNGLSWLIFDPVATDLPKYFPKLTPKSVELLSSWQPIVYLVSFIPMTQLQSGPDGLRKGVLVGTAFELSGSGLKAAATLVPNSDVSVVLLHLGQMLCGVASPVAIGAPAGLSAIWFAGSALRTRATAAAVVSNNVGNALGYAIIPKLSEWMGFSGALWLEHICSWILVVALLIGFPSPSGTNRRRRQLMKAAARTDASQGAMSPDSIESIDAEVADESLSPDKATAAALWSHFKALVSLKSGIVLCVAYAWSSGSYVAWMSLYEELIGGSVELSAAFVSVASLLATIGYIVGGLICSALTDVYFHHRMRQVLMVTSALAAVLAILFLVLLRSIRSDCRHSIRDGHLTCPSATAGAKALLLFLAAAVGSCTGAAAPVFYELLAEVSYPMPEIVSGNILSMFENAGALIMYQVVARFFKVTVINLVFVIGMILCVVAILLLVKEVHLRSGLNRRTVIPMDDDDDGDGDDWEELEAHNDALDPEHPAANGNGSRGGIRRSEESVMSSGDDLTALTGKEDAFHPRPSAAAANTTNVSGGGFSHATHNDSTISL